MSASIVNLSGSGLIKVSGPDAKKLLQGQLTCDLDEVSPTQSRMGAFCTPQGRVLSTFVVFMFADHYYLSMPASIVNNTLLALKKYAVFYKVTLEDASNSLFTLGYIEADSKPLAADNINLIKIPVNNNRCVIIGEHTSMTVLWNKLSKECSITSPAHWKYLDICAGIPTIYPETCNKFLPHDINLDELNAISFSKGCYTGQEIIARMHYRSKLKNRMYQATIISDHATQPGADIYCLENAKIKACGNVVDSCREENATDSSYRVLIVTDATNAINNHLFLDDGHGYYFVFK